MKTYVYLYIAEFFLEREMFQAEALQKNKTHILHSINFSPEILPFTR